MAMTVPHSGQVPTLRSALARARRAGANVENVHATGEVRVTWGDRRVVVNNRRKDSTRELTTLVETAEAAATMANPRLWSSSGPPAEARDPGPVSRPKPARTVAQTVEAHVRDVPADTEGWRPYSSPDIGADLGLTSTQVAIWANYAIRRGLLEARRLNPQVRGSHITHVRFLDLPGPGPKRTRTLQEAQEPAPAPERPRPIPLGVGEPEEAAHDLPGFLPVPTLSTYARALKLARLNDNRMVVAHLSEAERDAVIAEAVRLYWWARAAHSGRE